ncbi:hypothetical protein ACSXAK_15350 (plasmid) [Clostridium perfringens]
MDEIKKFKDSFLRHSKTWTKNYHVSVDKDKIYINKKFLEDNFFDTYQNMLFKDKLEIY